MIEHATVKFPAANRMIRLTLWRVSICSRMDSSIGTRNVMMSHTMVIDAVAWSILALGNEGASIFYVHSKPGSLRDTDPQSKVSSFSRPGGTGR
jgi:hypothetical protein